MKGIELTPAIDLYGPHKNLSRGKSIIDLFDKVLLEVDANPIAHLIDDVALECTFALEAIDDLFDRRHRLLKVPVHREITCNILFHPFLWVGLASLGPNRRHEIFARAVEQKMHVEYRVEVFRLHDQAATEALDSIHSKNGQHGSHHRSSIARSRHVANDAMGSTKNEACGRSHSGTDTAAHDGREPSIVDERLEIDPIAGPDLGKGFRLLHTRRQHHAARVDEVPDLALLVVWVTQATNLIPPDLWFPSLPLRAPSFRRACLTGSPPLASDLPLQQHTDSGVGFGRKQGYRHLSVRDAE